MTPLDTNRFLTCWLPLQTVPCEGDGGSGLVFASGSHRDVALHFWHGDPRKDSDCSERGYKESPTVRLAMGDATWHHGWTLHCASPNTLPQSRRALAISYFADDGTRRLRAPRRQPHNEDAESHAAWLPFVPPGKPARHDLLPLVWTHKQGARPLTAISVGPPSATSGGGAIRAGTAHKNTRTKSRRKRRPTRS